LEFAERRQMPVVSFVDTPGAWPGVDSERYAVAEAISRLLWKQAQVQARTVSVVLGEGGSGGALALAMADRMLMMQYAYFSVISPEACASILWRDGARTPQAAEKLRLLPEDLQEFGIVDEIVAEPDGGAHRYPTEALCVLRDRIRAHLEVLEAIPLDEVLKTRYRRYRGYGQVESAADVI
ncbi:MAG: acetyl-CoA carboxylase carboxyl transferase subunit alpha, partial [Candidatus Dadabacteria bacterium]